MFYLDSQTNTRYRVGTPFTYNGKQYTKAGATHETFIALGFTQVIIQPRPDDRFYVVSGPDNAGQYSATPRDLAELKTRFIREVKLLAFQLLKGTDWYIVRQTELGYSEAPVPVDVTAFRTAVRAASTSRCEAIEAITTVEDLKTLLGDSFAFPETPDEVTNYG
jgi:hypothetical protein